MDPSSSNNYDNQDFDPFERRQALDQRKRALHAEIQSVDSDVAKLNQLRQELDAELRDITRELEQLKQRKLTTADLHGLSRQSNGLYVQNERIQTKGRGRDNRRSEAQPGTNYFSQFDWSPELKRRMKRVFGFQDFRLCQEGYVYDSASAILIPNSTKHL
ncbi:hypothetical protein FRC19_010280 [Serendipita sp. 401]|nr:hypothetical protein FRC19_010280 [Serendipita sp. 401]